MARANRHYIPGCVWHITHRCHKQEFLFKFHKDRQRWSHWLFEAKKRYGLCILNYIITSNHIHLLVVDTDRDVISKSIQLIAGRTAQEYNQRKNRKGAFWEDRYHAVAVQTDKYLLKCLVYIDLNMVRAGVVKHPAEWQLSGYNEILYPPKRYSIIDRKVLIEKCGTSVNLQFSHDYKYLVEQELKINNNAYKRNSVWSESIAVGNKTYIEEIKESLKSRASGRTVNSKDDNFILSEVENPYNTVFSPQKSLLSVENAYYWYV